MDTSSTGNCSICLKSNSDLVAAGEADYGNVKWTCKLRFCVPEVIWNTDCLLCFECTKLLDVSCSFRNLCLKSTSFHLRALNETKVISCGCSVCNVPESPDPVGNDTVKQESFICYLCGEDFSTMSSLTEHIPSHSRCSICNERFTTATQLQQHVLHTHNDKKQNKMCVKQTNNCKYEIKYENEQDCNEDNFGTDLNDDSAETRMCTDPSKKPKAKTRLEKLRKQIRTTAFICEECKAVFASSKKLVDHTISVHGSDPSLIKPFHCDKCDGKFSTSSNLLQHKKYHMGKRTHICTFCGKGYITKSDLNTHEKQHLNKREYKCVVCPKTFNTHKDLRSHRLVVHTDPGLWNYVCTFCEKRFPIKSNLDQHLRRHTGEKRFGCHICEKRFVDKVVLQKHIKSHSNFRAYKCEHCAKEYKDSKVLEVHLTKVHGIGNAKIPIRVKKHFCHVCPKSYFAKNKLTRHMFSHTGEKPYVCHVCERKFTDKSYVKQHLKTAHNIFEMQENK